MSDSVTAAAAEMMMTIRITATGEAHITPQDIRIQPGDGMTATFAAPAAVELVLDPRPHVWVVVDEHVHNHTTDVIAVFSTEHAAERYANQHNQKSAQTVTNVIATPLDSWAT